MRACLLRLGILALPLTALADEPQTGVTGLQRDGVFSDYSPLSRSQELVRRLLTPLGESSIDGLILRRHCPFPRSAVAPT